MWGLKTNPVIIAGLFSPAQLAVVKNCLGVICLVFEVVSRDVTPRFFRETENFQLAR